MNNLILESHNEAATATKGKEKAANFPFPHNPGSRSQSQVGDSEIGVKC